MTGLNAMQADRLFNLQRRRTQVINDIETLRQTEQQMTSTRAQAGAIVTKFRDTSRKDGTEWRGQTGMRYDGNRSQAKADAQTFFGQMSDAIGLVSQQRSRLSTELTNINAEIRELELIAASGGV